VAPNRRVVGDGARPAWLLKNRRILASKTDKNVEALTEEGQKQRTRAAFRKDETIFLKAIEAAWDDRTPGPGP